MNSVVSLRTFTNASNVPIVVFVDMQQESMAGPRLLAISGIDRALANRRDAFHRSHKVTYPCDASAGHVLEEVSADDIHRAVCETDDWIASTLPRTLGIGNNAGG